MKITLMQAVNNGGFLVRIPASGVQEQLQYLGLIQLGPKYIGKALEAEKRKIALLWKKLAPLVRARNTRAAEHTLSDIRSIEYDLERKVWRLTPAAQQYLTKGRVVVVAGKQKKGEPA